MKVKIQERVTEKKENTSTKRRWGINEAMDKLREEMVSLMDQDLTLMKQLLNLNETIEDLKWQRSNYYSGSSSEESDFSVSETEMYADSSDNDVPHTKVSKSISNLQNKRPEQNTNVMEVSSYVQKASVIRSHKSIAAESTITTKASRSLTNLHKEHSEYRSFDSGINDTDHVEIRV
ncbi:hypothetical protein LOTGIDRAFT_174601 [Lottia gigantea]|uniref:Uncharacterized protein n=1 Tax=Lottia gigantea TaxID=225164 RepID=V4C663_LOTGI|nr:hypothetical protein LOTGIDRAFT_174601 [Lottia gigantea]ESO97119.1 hypothetical protein LOTGIDRAFT_174601 [Lottia gigantea]